MSFIKFSLYLMSFFYFPCYADLSVPAVAPLFNLFGDSTCDTGNAIVTFFQDLSLPASHPPYNENYTEAPMGRWSNGHIFIDYYVFSSRAESQNGGHPLDIIDYPSPLLPDVANGYGYNFAVAGSTALDASVFKSYNISIAAAFSLRNQILFYMSINSPCGPSYNIPCPTIIFGPIGLLDITYAHTQCKTPQEIMSLIPLIVNTTVTYMMEVLQGNQYPMIVIFLNYPLGCSPPIINYADYNNQTIYDEYGCVEIVNNYTIYQNELLKSAIEILKVQYNQTLFITVDYYELIMNYIKEPLKYGFEPTTILKPCCGNGAFKLTNEFCGSSGATVCSDPNE